MERPSRSFRASASACSCATAPFSMGRSVKLRTEWRAARRLMRSVRLSVAMCRSKGLGGVTVGAVMRVPFWRWPNGVRGMSLRQGMGLRWKAPRWRMSPRRRILRRRRSLKWGISRQSVSRWRALQREKGSRQRGCLWQGKGRSRILYTRASRLLPAHQVLGRGVRIAQHARSRERAAPNGRDERLRGSSSSFPADNDRRGLRPAEP